MREDINPCSFATSIIILKCAESLHNHSIELHVLDMVKAIVPRFKSRCALGNNLVRAVMDIIMGRPQEPRLILVQQLQSQGRFVELEDVDCRVGIDQDCLIVIKGDEDITYIRPPCYQLESDLILR